VRTGVLFWACTKNKYRERTEKTPLPFMQEIVGNKIMTTSKSPLNQQCMKTCINDKNVHLNKRWYEGICVKYQLPIVVIM
jgi:hypothetical protein